MQPIGAHMRHINEALLPDNHAVTEVLEARVTFFAISLNHANHLTAPLNSIDTKTQNILKLSVDFLVIIWETK